MKLSIIILHYGDLRTTKKCIESLFHKEHVHFSLIVVNNTEKIYSAKDFINKNITIINNKKNLGFAKGVNIGIARALEKRSDYVCLLNNDTIIKQSFLEKLLSIFRIRKDAGIVGPAIMFEKNKKALYDIGGKIDPFFLRTSHEEVAEVTSKAILKSQYVSGCCMVIASAVLKEIGKFDEHYFLYYEDADFCLRSKQAGFTTYVDPSVTIYHELSRSEGATSPFTIHHLIKSSIYFGKKFSRTPLQYLVYKLFVLFQSLLFFKANPSSGIVIAKALLQE